MCGIVGVFLKKDCLAEDYKNKLNESQSLWFREPRFAEELYDLENDPFEVNNLSVNDKYENELIYHRNLINDREFKMKLMCISQHLLNQWHQLVHSLLDHMML